MRHPVAGLLNLQFANLWLGQGLGTRIVALTPADDRTLERLKALTRDETLARPR